MKTIPLCTLRRGEEFQLEDGRGGTVDSKPPTKTQSVGCILDGRDGGLGEFRRLRPDTPVIRLQRTSPCYLPWNTRTDEARA